MQLIYRAQTYHFVPAPANTVQPRAINWRYAVTAAIASGPSVPHSTVAPRAINWRYRIPVMA